MIVNSSSNKAGAVMERRQVNDKQKYINFKIISLYMALSRDGFFSGDSLYDHLMRDSF